MYSYVSSDKFIYSYSSINLFISSYAYVNVYVLYVNQLPAASLIYRSMSLHQGPLYFISNFELMPTMHFLNFTLHTNIFGVSTFRTYLNSLNSLASSSTLPLPHRVTRCLATLHLNQFLLFLSFLFGHSLSLFPPLYLDTHFKISPKRFPFLIFHLPSWSKCIYFTPTYTSHPHFNLSHILLVESVNSTALKAPGNLQTKLPHVP